MIQRNGARSGSGGLVLLLVPLVLRSRLALALLPVQEMLGQASAEFSTVRRVAEDLDEAERRGHASQEPKAGPLGVPRGVGLVQEVGVLGVPRDLVLNDSDTGGIEGSLADLLGDLIERIAHDQDAYSLGERGQLSSTSPQHQC